MDIASAYLADIERTIAYVVRARDMHVPHLPTLSVEPYLAASGGLHTPWLTYPYDKKLREVLRLEMLAQGWQVAHESDESKMAHKWDDPNILFTRQVGEGDAVYSLRVILSFSDRLNGSTCKRVQIGEYQETKPIYDYACPEPAGAEYVAEHAQSV